MKNATMKKDKIKACLAKPAMGMAPSGTSAYSKKGAKPPLKIKKR